MISNDLLAVAVRAAAPDLTPAARSVWCGRLAHFLPIYDIATPRQIAGFLGNAAEETGGFVELVEDLSYSAVGIVNTWPARFRSIAQAQPYAHQPEKLGNYVYANRMGNGPPESGDGYRFRGHGLTQTTGRDDHARFAKALGMSIDDVAAYMATVEGAVHAGCWDWQQMRCGPIADDWDLRSLTETINGGLIGYGARVANCNAILKAIEGDQPPSPPPEDPADALMDAELKQLGTTTT